MVSFFKPFFGKIALVLLLRGASGDSVRTNIMTSDTQCQAIRSRKKYVPAPVSKEKLFAIYTDWGKGDATYMVFSNNPRMKKYLRSHGLKWKVAKRGWLFPDKAENVLKELANDCPDWKRLGVDETKVSFREHPIVEHLECVLN